MKGVKLLTVLLVLSTCIYAQDFKHSGDFNFGNISQLCHKEVRIDFIKIQSDLDLESLTKFDKSQFIESAKSETLKKDYFDASGDHAHQTLQTGHENIYPKWYTPAFKILINREGTTSYFDNADHFETKGWERSLPESDALHVYELNEESNIMSSLLPYNEASKKDYELSQNHFMDKGFLSSYVFRIPTEPELADYEYEWTKSLIRVVNNEDIIEWDLEKMEINYQEIDHGLLVQTITKNYQFNKEFKTFLIQFTLIVEPQKFENGDCYERISKTLYSNFNTHCENSLTIENRTNNLGQKKEQTLRIFPNPSSTNVTLELPDHRVDTSIKLYSMSGQLLMVRKVKAGVSQMELSVANLSKGIYLLKVKQGAKSYSNKLSKI